MEITASLTWGESGDITVTCGDEQPYSPDVADDLARRAVAALLDIYRQILTEATG